MVKERPAAHLQPGTIYTFRNIKEDDQFIIPEKYSNRKPTDNYVLTLLLFFILSYAAVMYCAQQWARPGILKNGYDKCGNICGIENEFDNDYKCSGLNLTDKPQMTLSFKKENDSYKLQIEECTPDCPEGKGFLALKRCYLYTNETKDLAMTQADNIFNFFIDEMNQNGWYLAIQVPIGIVITAAVFTLLVFQIRRVVRIFFFAGLLLQLSLAACLISIHATTPIHSITIRGVSFLFPAIVLLVFFLASLSFCALFGSEFELSLRLIEEAVHIFRQVPSTLLQPILTTVFQLVLIWGCFSLSLMLTTCYTLEPTDDPERYNFEPNKFIIFCYVYTACFGIWLFFFANGCEFIILTGAFAPFFFTRDRSTVKRPLPMSYAIVCTFHLGTVALGSMIIPIIAFCRYLLRKVIEHNMGGWLVDCCLLRCQDALEYITERTYIETFLHGQSFCKSAKRSVRLLAANLLLNLSIDDVAQTVFMNMWMSLTVLTLGIGFIIGIWVESHYFYIVTYVGALIICFFASSLFYILKTAIKTIFLLTILCFCEDQMLNNGKKQPYYMSKTILDLIKEAKELEVSKKQRRAKIYVDE